MVLRGQKIKINCNRATTARLKTEKFKYGQEEREAEAAKPPKPGTLLLEALGKAEVLLLAAPPAATHLVLDGAGHALERHQPEALATALRDLARQRG